MTRLLLVAGFGTLLAVFPVGAAAHGIGEVYASPIPLRYYLFGAASAVAASFLVSDTLLHTPLSAPSRLRVVKSPAIRVGVLVVRGLITFVVVLLIVAGMFGIQRGPNMAPYLFWVFLVVGLPSVALVVGNAWEFLNPWRALADAWAVWAPMPRRFVASPAIAPVLLFGLFWWELVSGVSTSPSAIAKVLVFYTMLTVTCGRIFENWYEDADPVGALLTLVGRIAPLRLGADARSLEVVRWSEIPLTANPWTLGVAGVLLGGASFDSLKESVIWFDWLRALRLDQLDPRLVGTGGLLLTVLCFILTYLLAVYTMALLVHRRGDWLALTRPFVYSLVPVALGYTLAHNFPLTVVVAPRLVALASDPLGLGWNTFGTATYETPLLLSAQVVWFVEIGLVILGHVGGIWLAHLTGLRVFRNGTLAARGQYPMALLMIGFTAVTLWLLSQPLVVAP
ncbi:MAG: hypothetical protein IT305_12225 [Chloroflexi bacterium]|nr:hypothetical protein [Chloroflexota bacterium]